MKALEDLDFTHTICVECHIGVSPQSWPFAQCSKATGHYYQHHIDRSVSERWGFNPGGYQELEAEREMLRRRIAELDISIDVSVLS